LKIGEASDRVLAFVRRPWMRLSEGGALLMAERLDDVWAVSGKRREMIVTQLGVARV
jgi:hypothetical protein